MKKLLLLTIVSIAITGCSHDNEASWDDPTIPVSIIGIEAVNIDNSGEVPTFINNATVKKEAYMLGVKWTTDNTPSDTDDKFITDPIYEGQQTYQSLSNKYLKAIKCNTQFNANIPAGKYVSKFFKEADRQFLPTDIDEGFVLLVAPDPGVHSFRVEYHLAGEVKFFYDTPSITFQ